MDWRKTLRTWREPPTIRCNRYHAASNLPRNKDLVHFTQVPSTDGPPLLLAANCLQETIRVAAD